MPTEQERAQAFRAGQLARQRKDKAAQKALRGSSAARKALDDAWSPVALALEEARNPGDDEC